MGRGGGGGGLSYKQTINLCPDKQTKVKSKMNDQNKILNLLNKNESLNVTLNTKKYWA